MGLRGIYIRLVGLVPAGLDGNRGPAVRRSLRQLGERLRIEPLHCTVRDPRPGRCGCHTAPQLSAGVSHRDVLLDAPRLQGMAKLARDGREVTAPCTGLPADNAA